MAHRFFCSGVFTTGEAAKICKFSQQTIIRAFDGGRLKGFIVPGSSHRRIPLEQLIVFMRKNGIPMHYLVTFMEDHGTSLEDLANFMKERGLPEKWLDHEDLGIEGVREKQPVL